VYSGNTVKKVLEDSGAAANLTHLNYAFGDVTEQGVCASLDPWADWQKPTAAADSVDGTGDADTQALKGNFEELRELKAKHPDLKVLISLGGWTKSKWFSDAVLTPASRIKLARSCVSLFVRGNLPGDAGQGLAAGIFDGIDVDWEYPGTEGNAGNIVRREDSRNYTLFLAEMRRQLDAVRPGLLLTAATSAAAAKAAKLELGNIGRSLDFINVMAYDFHGGWEAQGPTNFHSALRQDPASPGTLAEHALNVSDVVDFYVAGGFPKAKLNIGLPYYGTGWKGVPNVNNGLYQLAASALGSKGYRDLEALGYSKFRDPVTGQMWIYNGDEFWAYEDAQSAAAKAAWVKAQGLGGVMVWSLETDSADGALTNAIAQALK